MKLINTMLMAIGLLTLSSVGFASTLSYSTDVGYTGSTGSTGAILFDGNRIRLLPAPDSGTTGDIFFDLTSTIDSTIQVSVSSTNSDLDPTAQAIDSFLYLDTDIGAGNETGLFSSTLDTLIASGTGTLTAAIFNAIIETPSLYFLRFVTTAESSISGSVSAVPVPAAGILFASALFGAGFLGRRKKKAAKANMIGAFARTA